MTDEKSGAPGAGHRQAPSSIMISPDGEYWWDGAAWVEISDVAPRGAVLSPDSRYWYDGQNWHFLMQTTSDRDSWGKVYYTLSRDARVSLGGSYDSRAIGVQGAAGIVAALAAAILAIRQNPSGLDRALVIATLVALILVMIFTLYAVLHARWSKRVLPTYEEALEKLEFLDYGTYAFAAEMGIFAALLGFVTFGK